MFILDCRSTHCEKKKEHSSLKTSNALMSKNMFNVKREGTTTDLIKVKIREAIKIKIK